MCKLEPAFVAVPSPLIVILRLESLSKGVEYFKENLVWKAMDWRARRQLMNIARGATGILTSGNSWGNHMRCCNTYCCRRRALDAARVSGIMLIQYPNGDCTGILLGTGRERAAKQKTQFPWSRFMPDVLCRMEINRVDYVTYQRLKSWERNFRRQLHGNRRRKVPWNVESCVNSHGVTHCL
jgi:hypothetical protein